MIYDIFKELNISYKEITHAPVFTVEEALKEDIPNKIIGIECKNLFVKYKRNYYLLFLEATKKINLKEIAKILKLSFASSLELEQILKLLPGSVTPLGIINDVKHEVIIIIDEELKNNKVLVHPNINTKTLSINCNDLVRFINYFGNQYIFISFNI